MYLNCKTFFSFRYGTFSTKELVEVAIEQGVTALALTNINSTCDVWYFIELCMKAGIKPIPGVEVRNGDKLLYLLLAANNKGYTWINEFLSEHLLEKKPFPEASERTSFFDNPVDGFVIWPLLAKPLQELQANERFGVLPWELTKLYSLDCKNHATKFVVQQPVTFRDKKYFNVHRLLRAIDKNVLLSKLPPETCASVAESFISPGELIETFRHYPF